MAVLFKVRTGTLLPPKAGSVRGKPCPYVKLLAGDVIIPSILTPHLLIPPLHSWRGGQGER